MFTNLIFLYSIFFIAALVFSLIINRFLLKFSHNLGIRNINETIIRWSSTSKPSLGGISFYMIFLFSVIVISFVVPDSETFFNIPTLGLVVSVTIGFLMGLFDDAYNTNPRIKFITQLVCGATLIVTGTYIDIFNNDLLNYALTLFWVLGIMNSINMLDNMDGITTVVSLGIALALFTGLILGGNFLNPIMIIIIGLMSVLLGFLVYNWNPSRMYMGDTGSQFLGILLAALGIIFLWNGALFEGPNSGWMRFLSVALAFVLPISDTTTVFYKRISRGQSPFVGGKDHTTHHFSYLGLKDRQIAILYAFLSLLSASLVVAMTIFVDSWKSVHFVLFGGIFVAIFLLLFVVGNLNRHRSE